ncbi:DnaD domain protein [Paenibacillus sp. FSL L8-0499]|uniref:DnaD domain protein n=1 Tax=Paenibacillus sp. FSL L8-0499 TaxID=2975334 RepID=UPI0030F83685
MDGWIKLHRKIRENPVFNDMNLFRLWMICLTEATHKERDQMIGKQIVKLFPGEFVTGRFDLAEMYNRGLKKKEQKPPTTIWRWLENLEKHEFVVIKSNNKFSVVAVVKWLEYQTDGQQNGQQVVNKWSTDGQQVVTNKNVKNLENLKNISTTTDNEREITLGDTYTKVCGTFVMPETFKEFFSSVRTLGYTEVFCIELLLEASESSTAGKPSVRYLQTIFDRWHKEGIYSRSQSKERKETNRGGSVADKQDRLAFIDNL